jgi:polysaccharide export outer membrane protein
MGATWKDGGLRAALVLSFGLSFALSCSIRHGVSPDPGKAQSSPPSAADLISSRDGARLAAIATARAAAPLKGGYRIGPDDLLDVRIPDLLEAQSASTSRMVPGGTDLPVVTGAPAFQQGMRVSGTGDVSIPTLGPVRAAGLTPTELEVELARRLRSGGILRAPQVSVLVVEYRSRVVAVIGSVERPGLYPLTRAGTTLADLVWAAGGPNREAGRVVQFTPAGEPGDDGSPLHLDLEVMLHPGAQGTGVPNIAARPGDVISLEPAGSVLVDGWVEKPGSYPVTRGLTVGGAVAAAGGSVFAANRRQAVVKRVYGAGEDRFFIVDLDAVARGLAPDMPVTDGDVVRLPASMARLLPWGAWTVAREMVHVGGNVLLF